MAQIDNTANNNQIFSGLIKPALRGLSGLTGIPGLAEFGQNVSNLVSPPQQSPLVNPNQYSSPAGPKLPVKKTPVTPKTTPTPSAPAPKTTPAPNPAPSSNINPQTGSTLGMGPNVPYTGPVTETGPNQIAPVQLPQNTGVPTPTSNTVGGILPSLFAASAESPAVSAAKQNIQDLQNEYKNKIGEINISPIGLSEQGGEQGIINQIYAGKLDAAQQALATAQAQQATQVKGFESALGAVAPITGVPYGTQIVQPGLIGTQGGGAEIQPSDPFYQTLQTYAQLLATNQGSAIPASITGNSVLNAQLQKMAKQINPNYNVNVAAGAGAAQQSTAQTAGTAGVTAAQNVFNQAYGVYNQLQNATQNVEQFGTLLTSGMVDSTGNAINPSSAKFLNMPLAELRNQLSSAQQAQFDSTYAALKGKISGLLSVGGNEIPTQITADANKILDGSAPLGTLQATLQRIQQEGNILLKNQADIVNQNWQKIQTGGGTPQTNVPTGTPNPWH